MWFTLQDILSKVDAMKLNAYQFRVKSISRKNGRVALDGVLTCSRSKEDTALLSVKAVTPHGMRIIRKSGSIAIDVIVDV